MVHWTLYCVSQSTGCIIFDVCTGYAVAQWLGLHLQLLGVVMVAGVSFLAVLEHHFSTVDPGNIHDIVYMCVGGV